MRFGEQLHALKCARFRDGYLDYDFLKAKLEAIDALTGRGSANAASSPAATADGAAQQPRLRAHRHTLSYGSSGGVQQLQALLKEWALLLEAEIAKVNSYTASRVEDGKLAVASLSRAVHAAVDVYDSGAIVAAAQVAALEAEAEATSNFLCELDSFIAVNATGFEKIVKKGDKVTGLNTRVAVLARLEGLGFLNIRLDGFLTTLSDIWSALRRLRMPRELAAAQESGLWQAPEVFDRNTTKLWVRSEHVYRLKAALIKHLPILVYGKESGKFKAVTPLERDRVTSASDSGWITSVYLDNAALDCYHTRLARQDMATLTRVRWYGADAVPPPSAAVFIERKTHREGDEPSVKERFALRCSKVTELLNGSLDVAAFAESRVVQGEISAKSAEHMTQLGQEIQRDVATRNLRAMVRTVYKRTAWQLSTSNDVRVSLDTEMQLYDENCALPPGAFCCDGELLGRPSAVYNFQYAILEIKLATDVPPPWLAEILRQGWATPVKKFSKFLTACVALQTSRVRELPHWFAPDPDGGSTPIMAEASPLDVAAADALAACKLPAPDDPQDGDGSNGTHGPTFPKQSRNSGNDDSPYSAPLQLVTIAELQQTAGRAARVQQAQSSKGGTFAALDTDGTSVIAQNPLSALSLPPPALPPPEPSSATKTMPGLAQLMSVRVDRLQAVGNSLRRLSGAAMGAADWHGGSRRTGVGGGGGGGSGKGGGKGPAAASPRGSPAKSDPKVFFANERTFIQWMNVALLVFTLTMALLSYASPEARTVGFLLVPVVASFLLYPLYMFHWRANNMKKPGANFDDRRGPNLLVAVLLIALTTNAALTAKGAITTGGFLGSSTSSSSSNGNGGGSTSPQWVASRPVLGLRTVPSVCSKVAASPASPLLNSAVWRPASVALLPAWPQHVAVADAASLSVTMLDRPFSGEPVRLPVDGHQLRSVAQPAAAWEPGWPASSIYVAAAAAPAALTTSGTGASTDSKVQSVLLQYDTAVGAVNKSLDVQLDAVSIVAVPAGNASAGITGHLLLLATPDSVWTARSSDVTLIGHVNTAPDLLPYVSSDSRIDALAAIAFDGQGPLPTSPGAIAPAGTLGALYLLFPQRRELRAYAWPSWSPQGVWATPGSSTSWTGVAVDAAAGRIYLSSATGGEMWSLPLSSAASAPSVQPGTATALSPALAQCLA